MANRKKPAKNNHLEEAMALLIGNQAALEEQIARNDRERLKLQRARENLKRQKKRGLASTEECFDRVEERFSRIETLLLQLPKEIKKELSKLPEALKKEIGFDPQT